MMIFERGPARTDVLLDLQLFLGLPKDTVVGYVTIVIRLTLDCDCAPRIDYQEIPSRTNVIRPP